MIVGIIIALLLCLSLSTLFFSLIIASHDNKIINILAIIVLLLDVGLLVVVLNTPVEENRDIDTSINLYALGSGNGVHGTFILGGGGINDIQYYVGYTNIDDNKFTQVKFDASKSILILDDNETPRAETYKYHRKIFGLFDDEITNSTTYIYIPKDGLKNVYEIN